MKKASFLVTFLFLLLDAQGQVSEATTKPPVLYLGTSTGIDNYSGMIGIGAEIGFSPQATARLGVGIGSWGTKHTIALKYEDRMKTGWGYGVGFSSASGIKNLDLELRTTTGTRTVSIDLYRASSLNFFASRNWLLKNGKNRFILDLGYAVPLTNKNFYMLNDGSELSPDEDTLVRIIRPGGIIVGIGFMFGL